MTVSAAVSMDTMAANKQSFGPTNDRKITSLPSNLVQQYNAGSASVPSTPQFVRSRFVV